MHADRLRAAEATGAAAVKLIGSQLTPDKIVNAKSVENALRVLLAIGGSTNAIIHLTAIAGRAGVPVSLKRLNELSDTTPVLVNLKPVGNGYMEDFFAAGGIGALLRELKDLLHLDCHDGDRRDSGRTARRTTPAASSTARSSPSASKPLEPQGGLVALFGNLAPQGAILKRSAADSESVRARGQGGGVLLARRHGRARRRSQSRRHRERHSRAAERRPAFGVGDARGRLSADPQEARHARASRTWCACPTRA